MKNKTAIIGVGNKLMGDEGVGIHAIEYLRSLVCHPERSEGSQSSDLGDSSVVTLPQNDTQIDILDGGTGGMTIFHLFEKYDRVILIDVANFGGKPGEIRSYVIASPIKAGEAIPLTQLSSGDCFAGARNDLRLMPDSAQVSLHGTSLAGILELAKHLDKKMPKITIVAVQPKNISPTLELSDECAKSISDVVKRINTLELVSRPIFPSPDGRESRGG